jgi:protein TonB
MLCSPEVWTGQLSNRTYGLCFQQVPFVLPVRTRRNTGTRRFIGADRMYQEQLNGSGVYINVFEQSILIDNRPNKSWSLLASLSVELVAVSVMILIPLLYGDHLPDFHWHVVTVGPPVRQIETPPPTQTSAPVTSGPMRTVFQPPSSIHNPVNAERFNPGLSTSTIEAPPGIQTSSDGTGTGPALFGRTINIKPPVVSADPPPPHTGPIHISGGVQMAKLVKQVIPVYPPLAKNVRISGVVHLVGIIAKDGTIRNLQVIDGHPMLVQAAMAAVAQWVYKPTLLSGEPVEVICPIDVTFTLSH